MRYNERMNDIVHADIFFFISAIGAIVITIGAAITFYYIIGIVRDVRAVTKKVRTASDELERDFYELRSAVKDRGARVKSAFEFFVDFLAQQVPGARRKRKSSPTSETADATSEEN